ncbi:MAG TPA: glycoside hydrolase family 15 protein [Acidimicrobiales bacterium]|nr:glycoside hydrolase family 15 protein [Acidimicrobiales bacterium]
MTRLPRPRDEGGWAPLESYAVLGDGRSVALVADDGAVDWWPVPTIDAPPICAAVLDPVSGGAFEVAPVGDATCTRRYLPGTNVIETTWRTAGGTARVVDGLATGKAGRLPWTELTRRVEGVDGDVELQWRFLPGDRFGTSRPWAAWRSGVPVVAIGDQAVALLADVVDEPAEATVTSVEPHQVTGRITVGAGGRALVSAVAADHEPLYVSPTAKLSERLDRTVRGWESWTAGLTLPRRWGDQVTRSALALKTLLYEPGGAIAAAATTSLPEHVGGTKNWDYRYSWVRDSSYTVGAFMDLGLHEEVQAAVSWLLSALRESAPHMEIFYTLEGKPPPHGGVDELSVPGYRDSRPVRAGNSASGQVQLGVYGDLFDAIWRYVEAGHILDAETAMLLERLANQCCDRWRADDSGIWELPVRQPYTVSKMGCWVALDRAVRLADAGQLASGRTDRWRAEAGDVRAFVESACWSPDAGPRGAYTLWAGTTQLDAACLLAGRNGFDRGERLSATIDAVSAELRRGPRVWRASSMPLEEGAFVACTFWMVEAMAHAGRLDEAVELMELALAELPNDVGILSEESAADGAALGNLPQGLSHLALVNAAFTLDAALG